jgi:hypothetical protein
VGCCCRQQALLDTRPTSTMELESPVQPAAASPPSLQQQQQQQQQVNTSRKVCTSGLLLTSVGTAGRLAQHCLQFPCTATARHLLPGAHSLCLPLHCCHASAHTSARFYILQQQQQIASKHS